MTTNTDPRPPTALPVIDMQANSHELDRMNNGCPFDWLEPHIHVSPDYGTATFDVVGFGPGMPIPGRSTYHEAPAIPSWWDRLRGRTLDAVIRQVTRDIELAGRRKVTSDGVIEAVRDALRGSR